MSGFSVRTVQGRLWTALTLLAVAVLTVSTVTWIALQRVDARLQDLHQETLEQVAQALDLSRRSADLATSAPYLLNQRSNFTIQQEGAKLINVLDTVRQDWPQTRFGADRDGQPSVSVILDSMSDGVTDLVDASSELDAIQSAIRAQTGKLGILRNEASAAIEAPENQDAIRLIWWSLQSMNADALNAAYAGNLIGVGEEQRHYLQQRQALGPQALMPAQTRFLQRLEEIVWDNAGLFELRRQELSSNLNAQNALFRIRQDANRINEIASTYAGQAEAFLATERQASSGTIRNTRIAVAAISLVSLTLALAAAVYVSRYVTFNISRVSNAMVRLANGDHAIALPRRLGSEDEIGDLFRSFRSFRANALRLDRSNRQLDQRNALFEKVFVNISDGIAITDGAGRLTGRNPALAKILRIDAETRRSRHFMDWLRGGSFGMSVQRIGLAHDHRGYCELISDDGQTLEIRASKLPDDGRVWLVSDVTERRNMSDRLQQIDRIETLGKVAGDTAHDFANILSTIRTHNHLLQTQKAAERYTSLEAIENAVDFGASLTERLLAFARKQSLMPEIVHLNALIEGMAGLVEISLKPEVTLEISLPPEPVYALVDPGQFESALFNLLLNANHAISAAGKITVSLTRNAQNQARILISDTGKGMPKEILDHAIEPFFTTRADQGGTGLGLSIVYGFIRQTGGELNIQSAINQGTQIEVLLPIGEPDKANPQFEITMTSLLVEDDPTTRAAVRTLLKNQGFHVTCCATGEDALALLSTRRFNLLLSDLDLGGAVDGVSLVHAAKRAASQTQTIIMSGKSSGKATVPAHTTFIEKPVTPQNLAETLAVPRLIKLDQ